MKYVIQPKQKHENGLEKTRAQFSRGIGLPYLTSAVYDYHTANYESPQLLAVIDGRKVALPRYYKKKIYTKYQLKREAHKNKWQKIRKKRKQMRALLKQGIVNTKTYLLHLRIESAKRIITNNTKSTSL